MRLKMGDDNTVKIDIPASDNDPESLRIDVAWVGITNHRDEKLLYVVAGSEPLFVGENGKRLPVLSSDTWQALQWFAKNGDRLVALLNSTHLGDTLKDLRESAPTTDRKEFVTKVLKTIEKVCWPNRYSRIERQVDRVVYDAVISMCSGKEPMRIDVVCREKESFITLFGRAAEALRLRQQVYARYLGHSESVTVDDFRGYTPPPESLVESVDVVSSDKVRMRLRTFQQARYVKFDGKIYAVDRDDMKKIGFHALDLQFSSRGEFPNATAWDNRECTILANHPNIGSSGNVCLGDINNNREDGRTPTLGNFIAMMAMCNFDSAYWGRTCFDRIFRDLPPNVGSWSQIPGLRLLRDTSSSSSIF